MRRALFGMICVQRCAVRLEDVDADQRLAGCGVSERLTDMSNFLSEDREVSKGRDCKKGDDVP